MLEVTFQWSNWSWRLEWMFYAGDKGPLNSHYTGIDPIHSTQPTNQPTRSDVSWNCISSLQLQLLHWKVPSNSQAAAALLVDLLCTKVGSLEVKHYIANNFHHKRKTLLHDLLLFINQRGAASQIARGQDPVCNQAVYFIFGLVAVLLANNGPIWKVRPEKWVLQYIQ